MFHLRHFRKCKNHPIANIRTTQIRTNTHFYAHVEKELALKAVALHTFTSTVVYYCKYSVIQDKISS